MLNERMGFGAFGVDTVCRLAFVCLLSLWQLLGLWKVKSVFLTACSEYISARDFSILHTPRDDALSLWLS